MDDRRVDGSLEHLPLFDGDPLSASKWLEDFERFSLDLSLDQDEMAAEAHKCCKGIASERLYGCNGTLQSWEEFKDDFHARFLTPEALKASATSKLTRLRQKDGAAFCEHLIEVQQLCHIVDPEVSEMEQITWFLKSVRADYRPVLVVAGLDSVNSLRDKCAHIDSIELFHNKEPEPPNPALGRLHTSIPAVFETRESGKPSQFTSPAPHVIPECREGSTRRRTTRPYCTFCGRYGHVVETCYRKNGFHGVFSHNTR